MADQVVVAGGLWIEHDGDVETLPADAHGTRTRVLASWLHRVAGPGALLARGAREGRGAVALLGRVGADDAGRMIRDELSAAGVDVAGVVTSPGPTTAALRVDSDVVLSPPPGIDGSTPVGPQVVQACRPGDALVLDAFALPDARPLLDAAEDADLQIVADLVPFPSLRRHAVVSALRRCDLVVVDAPGAGLLADAGLLPASTLICGDEHCAWDDEVFPGLGPLDLHLSLGRLAAALAAGADRPEALALATGQLPGGVHEGG